MAITAAVQELSHSVEMVILPGEKHDIDILEMRPDLAEYIAVWFEKVLG